MQVAIVSGKKNRVLIGSHLFLQAHPDRGTNIVQSGFFSVGSCINGKESSLIPTLRSENTGHFDWMLHPEEDWSIRRNVSQSQSWSQRTPFSD